MIRPARTRAVDTQAWLWKNAPGEAEMQVGRWRLKSFRRDAHPKLWGSLLGFAMVSIGLTSGAALATTYDSNTYFTHSHNGTTFNISTEITYTVSGTQWKAQTSSATFTVNSGGTLVCSRGRLLASGVVKKDVSNLDDPYPVTQFTGQIVDTINWAMVNWQNFELKFVWRNDNTTVNITTCALGGGVQLVKASAGTGWSEAGNPLIP
jgi:hypothetical protein